MRLSFGGSYTRDELEANSLLTGSGSGERPFGTFTAWPSNETAQLTWLKWQSFTTGRGHKFTSHTETASSEPRKAARVGGVVFLPVLRWRVAPSGPTPHNYRIRCRVVWRAGPSVTLRVTQRPDFVANASETCEFRPDFHLGGMAEWSMAVVLKTWPIGYPKTVIFRPLDSTTTLRNPARIRQPERFPTPTR
jgi:hypothetical protein